MLRIVFISSNENPRSVLGADIAARGDTQGKRDRGLVVRRLADRNDIVLTERPIKALEGLYIEQKKKISSLGIKPTEPDMPTKSHDDGLIDELLHLAGVSTENSAARSWLESALATARSIGDASSPQPPPGKYNVPLDKIARTSDRLIALLGQLRRHPRAYASFWSFAAFGPVYASEFERPGVIRTLTDIRAAARKAPSGRTGRPRKSRKQHIVDLALAFCARFSRKRPGADVNNFFPSFAERFFELSTGLSAEEKGHGIGRQITVALRRLPFEKQRAGFLHKTNLR